MRTIICFIKILIVIMIANLVVWQYGYSQKYISQKDAEMIAMKWIQKTNKDSLKSKQIKRVSKNRLLYHVVYDDNSSVIVSSKKGILPVVAYSRNRSLSEENLTYLEKKWIECVNEYIDEHTADSSINLATGDTLTLQSNFKSEFAEKLLITGVQPLFESTQSSRWAYWDPYSRELPYQNGDNICVPLAMAQLMKYYKFPIQGTNTKSYIWDDQGVDVELSVDFTRQWYNWNNMPFRLTYCGAGSPGCNETTFNLLPDITDEQISEVSRLIYQCGVAVEMHWQGNNPPPPYYYSGTYGYTDKFASALNQYFDYRSDWIYYDNNAIAADNNAIAADNNGFKQALRNELQNNRPVLFNYFAPGHLVVIDGYENENYFHFACGWGGAGDAFYYLFDLDNDGIHNQTPHHDSYNAALGIYPNCPSNSNLTVQNSTIQTTENITYSATGLVNINNVLILGNGTSGGRVNISGNEVNLNSGFEVQPGATLFIHPSGCSQP